MPDFYFVRPNGETNKSLWQIVDAAAFPQVVGSLAAGSFQVRALGASDWTDPVTVTDPPAAFSFTENWSSFAVGDRLDQSANWVEFEPSTREARVREVAGQRFCHAELSTGIARIAQTGITHAQRVRASTVMLGNTNPPQGTLLLLGMSDDFQTGYQAGIRADGEWRIERWNAGPGGLTQIATGMTTPTGATPVEIEFTRTAAGLLTLRRNGVVLGSVTDTTHTGGRPGIRQTSSATDRQWHRCQSFFCEDLV